MTNLDYSMSNGLTKRNEETIWAIFKRYPKVESVYVFGSRAKESFKEGSDIDLVIMRGDVSYLDLIRIKSAFEDSDLPYTVDVLYYAEIKNKELKAHIDRIGKPFYKRKALASSILSN